MGLGSVSPRTSLCTHAVVINVAFSAWKATAYNGLRDTALTRSLVEQAKCDKHMATYNSYGFDFIP